MWNFCGSFDNQIKWNALISDSDDVLMVEDCVIWWNFPHHLLNTLSKPLRLVHSSNHKLSWEPMASWVLASGLHAFHFLLLSHKHMVLSMRFPCSGILATQRFRWSPGCAGRRNSEEIWGRSGKTGRDLEGLKNHPGSDFRLLSACGKQDEFWQ